MSTCTTIEPAHTTIFDLNCFLSKQLLGCRPMWFALESYPCIYVEEKVCGTHIVHWAMVHRAAVDISNLNESCPNCWHVNREKIVACQTNRKQVSEDTRHSYQKGWLHNPHLPPLATCLDAGSGIRQGSIRGCQLTTESKQTKER